MVAVYDTGRQDSGPYLVMELLDGVELQRLVDVCGPLEPDVARWIASGMSAALAAAAGITRASGLVGTPQYMAPEDMRGERPAPRSDLYGLGPCLYLMLTGEPPLGPVEDPGGDRANGPRAQCTGAVPLRSRGRAGRPAAGARPAAGRARHGRADQPDEPEPDPSGQPGQSDPSGQPSQPPNSSRPLSAWSSSACRPSSSLASLSALALLPAARAASICPRSLSTAS